jgi:hypothetical protein
MKPRLFEVFSRTISDLPPKAVLRVVRLEREMLEGDLSQKRELPLEDVNSILWFCRCVENFSWKANETPSHLPAHHIAFYKKIVEKLVQCGELPVDSPDLETGLNASH